MLDCSTPVLVVANLPANCLIILAWMIPTMSVRT